MRGDEPDEHESDDTSGPRRLVLWLGAGALLALLLSAPLWIWLKGVEQSEKVIAEHHWSHYQVVQWLATIKVIDGFLVVAVLGAVVAPMWMRIAERGSKR